MTPKRAVHLDVRCERCEALLAHRDLETFALRRGRMQATFDGVFSASIVCYRCGTLNVFRHGVSSRGPGGVLVSPLD